MNVKNLHINLPCLKRCVEMVSHFKPDLIPSDMIDEEVDLIIQNTIESISHKTKDPFVSYMSSVGKCIQVSYVKVFDQSTREYLDDSVKCVYTVQPIVVSESDIPLTVIPL